MGIERDCVHPKRGSAAFYRLSPIGGGKSETHAFAQHLIHLSQSKSLEGESCQPYSSADTNSAVGEGTLVDGLEDED